MDMRNIIKASLIWCGMLLPLYTYGQYSYSYWPGQEIPLGTLPMLYNGSFAGETGGPRISSNLRLNAINNTYKGTDYHLHTSYDQFIPAIRSGIGITAGVGTGNSMPTSSIKEKFNDNMVSLAIAPKFSIKGKYTLSPSVDFTYNSFNINVEFAPGTYIDTTRPKDFKYQYLQSSAGILFNTNKFYIGYSIYLIEQVIYKQITYPSSLYDFNSILQLGYTFQRSSSSKFSFTPQLAFRIYKLRSNVVANHAVGIDFLEAFNLNFRYKQFIWGINNAGFHLGW